MKTKWILAILGLCVFYTAIPFEGKAATSFIRADVLSLTTNAVSTGNLELGSLAVNHGYYLFPYYLRVEFPEINNTAWGIQMYTDNNPDNMWSSPNGVYGGLRGVTDPSHGIPVYWQVYNDFQNAAPYWGTPQSITITAGGLGFRENTVSFWGRLYDRRDSDVVNNWNSTEAVSGRTIASYRGMGFYPAQGRLTAVTPIYVYLGMNLTNVSVSQDYRTRLRLDLYNLGVDISQGGYATPNPFTPVTGQRTNFNFYLTDINAAFKINVFTIRGRKVRTITDSREWDGRNDSGQLVEGGLYIYQIEAEGRRISGTVVLIK